MSQFKNLLPLTFARSNNLIPEAQQFSYFFRRYTTNTNEDQGNEQQPNQPQNFINQMGERLNNGLEQLAEIENFNQQHHRENLILSTSQRSVIIHTDHTYTGLEVRLEEQERQFKDILKINNQESKEKPEEEYEFTGSPSPSPTPGFSEKPMGESANHHLD